MSPIRISRHDSSFVIWSLALFGKPPWDVLRSFSPNVSNPSFYVYYNRKPTFETQFESHAVEARDSDQVKEFQKLYFDTSKKTQSRP